MRKIRVKRGFKFPTFAVIVFLFALFWFLEEVGYFVIDVPWLPLILMVIALGWIFNRLF